MNDGLAGRPTMFPRMGAAVIPGLGESHSIALPLASAKVVRNTLIDVVLRYESRTETTKPFGNHPRESS